MKWAGLIISVGGSCQSVDDIWWVFSAVARQCNLLTDVHLDTDCAGHVLDTDRAGHVLLLMK